MLQTPVLLLIFNRPDTTNKVFEVIKRIQPSHLYIAADGARNEDEREKCEQARKVTEDINWECNIQRLYREKNLGCKKAVIQAINWFFEHEEQGIILEDDCVPDDSFFAFCTSMLNHYSDKTRIKTISGTNFLYGKCDKVNDYFFLNYTMIWGWATWKRAWEEIDWNKKFSIPEVEQKIEQSYSNIRFRYWLTNLIYPFINNPDPAKDTWDVHVLISFLLNDGLSIIPSKNLISNIGVEGTHSFTDSKSVNTPTRSIQAYSLPEMKNIEVTDTIQAIFMQNVVDIYMPKQTIITRVKQKIRQYIR